MQIRHFFTPGLSIISHLIFDEGTRTGAIIDPTRHIEQYLRCAAQENITISDIIETHVHADFASGSQELKEALKGAAKIHCSGLGGKEWIPKYADRVVGDRDEILLGNVRLQAWHTPGHTPEHLIWVAFDNQRSRTLPAVCFTGDLLFVGSIGRPDLLGNEAEVQLARQLYDSLFGIIGPLQDFVEIFPSHGAGSVCGKEIGARPSSTLGYERQCNPWLLHQPYKKWSENLLKNMPAAPAYFKYMKRINISGPATAARIQERPPLISIEEAVKRMPSSIIIDVRNNESFAAGHLKDSINIPIAPSFATWAGSVLPENAGLIIVIEDGAEAHFAIQSLRLIGMDNVIGVCNAREWDKRKYADIIHASPMAEVHEIEKRKGEWYILDVRSPGEWGSGHIHEAHHIELAQISNSLQQIPKNLPIAVFCHAGTRASLIASLLRREGFSKAAAVRGGMQAWINAGLPYL